MIKNLRSSLSVFLILLTAIGILILNTPLAAAVESQQIPANALRLNASEANSAQAIQRKIDALPVDRKEIATLKLVGSFVLQESILLPSYTRLDLTEARLTLAAGADVPLLTNLDHEQGNTRIEIHGGILDGNRQEQSSGDAHGILLVRAEQVRISNLEVINCRGDGIRLSGLGRHTQDTELNNLRVTDNARNGLVISHAMRRVMVNGITAVGNGQMGIISDHSESLYQNIVADRNQGRGIFIRNVFGNTYNNMTATRNGEVGIYVLGLVCSRGSNWGAHNNSLKAYDHYSEIFFSADDSLSYGRTAQSVLTGIIAGRYNEFGHGRAKQVLEFGEGEFDRVQIMNLIKLQEK